MRRWEIMKWWEDGEFLFKYYCSLILQANHWSLLPEKQRKKEMKTFEGIKASRESILKHFYNDSSITLSASIVPCTEGACVYRRSMSGRADRREAARAKRGADLGILTIRGRWELEEWRTDLQMLQRTNMALFGDQGGERENPAGWRGRDRGRENENLLAICVWDHFPQCEMQSFRPVVLAEKLLTK